jgi:hypothetical protein
LCELFYCTTSIGANGTQIIILLPIVLKRTFGSLDLMNTTRFQEM